MNCALVDEQTNIVANIIVANPSVDQPPSGMLLIALEEGSTVSIGWVYNSSTGEFTNPFPVGP
jgi:hypothetical protein